VLKTKMASSWWWSFPALVALSVALAVATPRRASAQVHEGRPWLGVALDSDEHGGAGVRVGHVTRGSPADKAGLREGDRILRVGTVNVSRGAEVVHEVAGHAIGESLRLAFVRAGAEKGAVAVLAPMPSQDDMLRMDLVGSFAPTWRDLTAASGTLPQSISDLHGKVVLIDFWATWCAPCRVSIPKLGALQARYGAQGLNVIGISTEDLQDVASFAQRMGMHYPVAVDPRGGTTRAYGIISMPTMVVVDKRGVVREVSVGYDPSGDTRLEATLRALLQEAPVD
jgi:peroxiredoxin